MRMQVFKALPAAALALCLSATGCSLAEDVSQSITVRTIPDGANCLITRGGDLVGTINPTPGSLTVRKMQSALTITCGKPGYAQAVYYNPLTRHGPQSSWFADPALGENTGYTSPVVITLH